MRRAALVGVLVLAACKKEEVAAPPAPAVRADAVTGGSAGPRLQVPIGRADAPPKLTFAIAKVYEQQQPTAQPPFHADGGPWTFFDATLDDGTPFTVGLFDRLRLKSDPPMTLVDAALSVGSTADGETLARAYAKAFGAKEHAAGKAGGLVPLKINSVNLGEKVGRTAGGGFGGSGSWTASKWTIERAQHATEVYFNFSLDEKKGEWSQKDADDDPEVVQDFMEVLHDGRP